MFLNDDTLVTCFILNAILVYGIIIQTSVCVGFESTNNYYIHLSSCSELVARPQLIMMS